MKIVVSDPSDELVVSVALVKAHLNLPADTTDDDELVELLIGASTERAEHQLGRSLLTKEYTATALPTEKLVLLPNLGDITSITVTDSDGVETVLTDDDYALLETSAIPVVDLVSTEGAQVLIVFTAGYGAAADVPKAIKRWVLVDVATLYEYREAIQAGGVAGVPYPFVDGLLDPYRVSY